MINLANKTDVIILGSALNFILVNILTLLFVNLLILWIILFLGIEALLLGGKHLNPWIIKFFSHGGQEELSPPLVPEISPVAEPSTPPRSDEHPVLVGDSPTVNVIHPQAINIASASTKILTPITVVNDSPVSETPRPILPPNTLLFSGNRNTLQPIAPEIVLENTLESNLSPASVSLPIVRPYLEPRLREIAVPQLVITPQLEEEISGKLTYSAPDAEKKSRPLIPGSERNLPEVALILPLEEESLIEELTDLPIPDIEETSELETVREIKKVPRRVKHRGIRLKSSPGQ